MADLSLNALDDLAVLGVRGADALAFLNGQLSQDITTLPDRGALLAGLHNAQGRCLALLRLIHVDEGHVLLVLPAELAEAVRLLLARFVLRSRVKIEDAAAWHVYGITGPDAEAAASTRLHMPMDEAGLRQLIVAPRGESLPQGEAAPRESWRADDVAAGIPEILRATSGLWVAQMLNLDLIDAVSFTKGCYTGQEVIARAHYRGQVKRRMQRFFTEDEAPLPPGARVLLNDGRAAQIVMSAPGQGGGREFLAVTAIHAQGTAQTGDEPPAQTVTAATLPLPYAAVEGAIA
jgi:folate-binding protein YgfZ